MRESEALGGCARLRAQTNASAYSLVSLDAAAAQNLVTGVFFFVLDRALRRAWMSCFNWRMAARPSVTRRTRELESRCARGDCAALIRLVATQGVRLLFLVSRRRNRIRIAVRSSIISGRMFLPSILDLARRDRGSFRRRRHRLLDSRGGHRVDPCRPKSRRKPLLYEEIRFALRQLPEFCRFAALVCSTATISGSSAVCWAASLSNTLGNS